MSDVEDIKLSHRVHRYSLPLELVDGEFCTCDNTRCAGGSVMACDSVPPRWLMLVVCYIEMILLS